MHKFATFVIVSITTMACVSLTAAHAELPYIDNRSDAATLIQSLYNAINRREYARAFGYFSTPPNENFEAYAKGYDGTERVELATGPVTMEGVAGSTMYTVPVAIKSYNADKSEMVFAGCYTVKLANPSIQRPPFRAMTIESGKLKPSDSYGVEGAWPESCSGQPVALQAPTLADATTAYLTLFATSCPQASAVAAGSTAGETHELSFKFSGSAETSKASLFVFPCRMAAYNETHVYFLGTDLDGLRPVAFTEPVLNIAYGDDESRTLKTLFIEGFDSGMEAVNSNFDALTQTITTFSKWRGVADASSNASHRFKEGRFVLWNYDADPTYDEEINPLSIMKDGIALVKPVPLD